MRVGIIAEGPGDLAVITNLLKGWIDLDREHIQYLRPEYNLDETDRHTQPEERFSNWELVKHECVSYSRIDEFLNSPIDEERLVIIHIDAAECELPGYGVMRPNKDKARADIEHTKELHTRIAAKIAEWMAAHSDSRVRYAIAIEETDAWLLTLHLSKDTSTYPNPKQTLLRELHQSNSLSDKERKSLFQMSAFKRYDELSIDFRKKKKLRDCMKRNESLRIFLESLEG